MTFRARRYLNSPVYHCWLLRDEGALLYGTLYPTQVESVADFFRGAQVPVEIEESPLGFAGEENIKPMPTEHGLFGQE